MGFDFAGVLRMEPFAVLCLISGLVFPYINFEQKKQEFETLDVNLACLFLVPVPHKGCGFQLSFLILPCVQEESISALATESESDTHTMEELIVLDGHEGAVKWFVPFSSRSPQISI